MGATYFYRTVACIGSYCDWTLCKDGSAVTVGPNASNGAIKIWCSHRASPFKDTKSNLAQNQTNAIAPVQYGPDSMYRPYSSLLLALVGARADRATRQSPIMHVGCDAMQRATM